MSEEKKVEQDERGAHLQLLDEVLEAKSVMLAAGCKQATFGEMFAEYARAASTSANGDRFDPYRLKVAEECCERLMSACTDAGCPDGVRMDDWIRENIRSTSTNVAQGAEAIYQIRTLRAGSPAWIDADKATAEHLQNNGAHELRIVYTAPPAQTATTDDARDAARWRWFTQNYGALNLHEKFAGNTPRVFTHGLKGRSWGEITRTIDAALTAAQSGDKS